jgi:hypothetical protein
MEFIKLFILANSFLILSWSFKAFLEPPFLLESQESVSAFLKIRPEAIAVMAAGHLPALLDAWFLSAMQDAEVSRVTNAYSSLYYRLFLIASLDPAYFEVYQAGGNLLAIVRKDAQGARDLLLQGQKFLNEHWKDYPLEFQERFWSRAWNVPMLLGYVYLFLFDKMRDAAFFFEKASEYADAPVYLKNLKEKFTKKEGVYQVGLSLLKFMISGATDEKLKINLLKRLDHLVVQYELFKMQYAFDQFRSNQRTKSTAEQDWKHFLQKNHLSYRDPWGGFWKIDAYGKVQTTTFYQSVFGL